MCRPAALDLRLRRLSKGKLFLMIHIEQKRVYFTELYNEAAFANSLAKGLLNRFMPTLIITSFYVNFKTGYVE